MALPYEHSGRTLNNMDIRVGSGGQIVSDNISVATSQSMHTLQPVVVDSGWPSGLMSVDPSTGTLVPSLNAMMMMMMPQAGGQYPVMFSSGQPVSFADKMSADGFSHMFSMAGNPQSAAVGHSTIDVKQLNSLQSNMESWMKPSQPAAVTATAGPVVETKNASQEQVNHPSPPKRPLSAYMRFSKQVWVSVKEANPGLSVCEIGGIIGRMWRELSDAQKKCYSTDFEQEKNKYDVEIKAYLQMTGLKSSDLNKPKVNKKPANPKKTPVKPQSAESHNHNGTAGGQVWTGNQPEHVLNNNGERSAVAAMLTNSVPNSAGQQQQATPQSNGNRMDSMVVFHMTDDGNSECYVERGQTVAELKASEAPPYQQHGGSMAGGMPTSGTQSAINSGELMRTVTELRDELTKAYRCINELRQENNLLRQMHEAQIPMR